MALLLCLALAGCGSRSSTTNADVDYGSDTVDAPTSQGELVGSWPKDVPLPPDLAVATSAETGGAFTASGAVPSGREALAFLERELPAAGWKIDVARETAPGAYQVIAFKAGRELIANMRGGEGEDSFSISIE